MREYANLGAERFEIKWVTLGVRVEVNCKPGSVTLTMSPIASFNIGGTWRLHEDVLKKVAPSVSYPCLQERFDDSWYRSRLLSAT